VRAALDKKLPPRFDNVCGIRHKAGANRHQTPLTSCGSSSQPNSMPPVWIEHYPKEATDGTSETFELVVFSSYEVKERAPYLGETRLTIGEPTWKTLDRQSVEALVGQAV
jgi:hypothetical protein